MNPTNIRCMKMHMINHGKVDLGSKLSGLLLTQKKGMLAGGSSERDLMDCPKMSQPQYDICKECQFSVPMQAADEDGFGV